MGISMLYPTHPEMISALDTEALRRLHLITELFAPDGLSLTLSHVERMLVGGAMPVTRAVEIRTADPAWSAVASNGANSGSSTSAAKAVSKSTVRRTRCDRVMGCMSVPAPGS